MKKISRLVCALLCAALLLSASAFAAGDGFNASLTIDRSAAGQISVTVAQSSVLAEKKPTLTIPCDFTAAYVSFGGSVIASALDAAKKEISFTVAAGGTYVIRSGAAPAPAAPSEVTVPVTGNGSVSVAAEVEGSSASVKADAETLEKVLAGGADELKIDLRALGGADTAGLPAAVFDSAAGAGAGVTVATAGGSVSFDAESTAGIAAAGGKDFEVSVKKAGEIENRPLYEITLLADGKALSQFDGQVTVSLPYAPAAGEDVNYITVWLRTGEGKFAEVHGAYDAVSGCVVFKVTRFSEYVIGYFPFDDVDSGKWYYSDAVYAYLSGLFEGTGGARFSPETPMTRAMVVTVLWRMEGSPVPASSSAYVDLTQDWYADAVSWASGQKIVEGYGAGRFGPEDGVTREQLVAILWRYAKYKGCDVSVGEDTNILSYSDAESVSEYAVPAMQWACGAGLVEGDGGALRPRDSAVRAQIAAVLHRYCENVK